MVSTVKEVNAAITTEVLEAYNQLLKTEEKIAELQPVYTAITTEVLEAKVYLDEDEGTRILTDKNAWTMAESDFISYRTIINNRLVAAGWDIDLTAEVCLCPLLSQKTKKVTLQKFLRSAFNFPETGAQQIHRTKVNDLIKKLLNNYILESK